MCTITVRITVCVPDLHSCARCSCSLVIWSTYPHWDYKTPPRPGYRSRRHLRSHTADCWPHTLLQRDAWHQRTQRWLGTVWVGTSRLNIHQFTCVPATHVHISHLFPGAGDGVVHLTALPDQGAIVPAHCIQQTFQHTHPCLSKHAEYRHKSV